MAQSIRVSDEMYELAQRSGAALGRSLAQQLEYWARLGARVDLGLTAAQAIELLSSSPTVASLVGAQAAGHQGIAQKHAEVLEQVRTGQRSAATLVVIPGALVQSAHLQFPEHAFDSEQSW